MAVWHVYVSLHLMWLAAARSSSPLLPMPQCKALGPAAAPRGALVPVAPSAPCSMAGWPAPRRTRADHADRLSLHSAPSAFATAAAALCSVAGCLSPWGARAYHASV